MLVIVVKNYEEMSKAGYEVIKDVVLKNPKAVLGLATGSTPIGIYKNMIADCQNGEVSYKDITTVNLDEYIGLDKSDDQSYVYFMNENLFNHIDIDKKNTNLPNGRAIDPQAECARYTELVKNTRQDLQLLGLGSNGHIGFNEPNTPFSSTTHIVDLTENTIKDNARFFTSIDDVPTQAITMGIQNITDAKKILIVASGKNKADAVYKMVKGTVSEDCPASVLQNHKDVVVIVDEDAASKIQ
ncbi:MAG: glucosamine-6-phosphate deaminase [Clostridia bacterium]